MFVVPVWAETLSREGEEQNRRCPSSDWAERGRCDRLWSALFYRMTAEGEAEGHTLLALGLLDAPETFPLASEICVDA